MGERVSTFPGARKQSRETNLILNAVLEKTKDVVHVRSAGGRTSLLALGTMVDGGTDSGTSSGVTGVVAYRKDELVRVGMDEARKGSRGNEERPKTHHQFVLQIRVGQYTLSPRWQATGNVRGA
jgi:hypothetical protein